MSKRTRSANASNDQPAEKLPQKTSKTGALSTPQSSAPSASTDQYGETPVEVLKNKMEEVEMRMGGGGFLQLDPVGESGESEDEDDNEAIVLQTAEDCARQRYIHVPPDREQAFKRMERCLLGSQAGDVVMMFNTSFSYTIFAALHEKVPKIVKLKDKKKAFNELLALTKTIHEYDYWMMDNEDPDELKSLMEGLAKAWKALLQCDDATLGIDAEFTRPGTEQLLALLAATLRTVGAEFAW